MVKVLSRRDFISSLKEIIKVNENKSYSDKLKNRMLDNFVEAYAPEEREMFEIQDMNTGEYIVKVEEEFPLGEEEGQEFPFVSVSEREFINMEDEYRYFTGGELKFINMVAYKTTSVGKW